MGTSINRFIIYNKENGKWLKKTTSYRSYKWMDDPNQATVFRNIAAIKLSVGILVPNTKRKTDGTEEERWKANYHKPHYVFSHFPDWVEIKEVTFNV